MNDQEEFLFKWIQQYHDKALEVREQDTLLRIIIRNDAKCLASLMTALSGKKRIAYISALSNIIEFRLFCVNEHKLNVPWRAGDVYNLQKENEVKKNLLFLWLVSQNHDGALRGNKQEHGWA